jgi:hypothetical protein
MGRGPRRTSTVCPSAGPVRPAIVEGYRRCNLQHPQNRVPTRQTEQSMAARSSDVPDVRDTELDRADLEEAARELGIEDVDGLDDQTLFERIGVGLGEIDEEQLDHPDDEPEAAEDEAEEPESADEGEEPDDRGSEADEELEASGEGEEPEPEDEEPEATEESEERHPVHDDGEYRVEDDPRDGVEPVIDLELGPLAIDVLGLEIHLNRLHAAITANPGPDHALIGKLLARIARLLERVGLGKLTDQITDAVDTAVDAVPGGDSDSDEPGDEQGGPLHKLTSPFRGLAHGITDRFGDR